MQIVMADESFELVVRGGDEMDHLGFCDYTHEYIRELGIKLGMEGLESVHFELALYGTGKSAKGYKLFNGWDRVPCILSLGP